MKSEDTLTNDLTPSSSYDILKDTSIPDNINTDVLEIFSDTSEEEMLAKFFNFNCIILYGYIDKSIAWQITSGSSSISTPLELYESQYTAKLITSQIQNKQPLAFAVYVRDNVYDELDLQLEDNIKKTKKKPDEIKKTVDVIRSLKKYETQGKKTKPYIVYTIQNKRVIKQIMPLQSQEHS